MKSPYYVVQDPEEIWSIRFSIYTEYVTSLLEYGEIIYKMRCCGWSCASCRHSMESYKVCPGCGSEPNIHGQGYNSICSCGTWLKVCGFGVISNYIIPSIISKEMMKDDTI